MIISSKQLGDVTIKAIKRQNDHEGIPYVESSNIYLNNKKVGTYCENYMAGPSEVEINDNANETIVKIAKAYLKKYPFGFLKKNNFSLEDLYDTNPEECLCDELILMSDIEKEAKKTFKKGYEFFAVTRKSKNHCLQYWSIPNKNGLAKVKMENEVLFVASSEKDFIFEI